MDVFWMIYLCGIINNISFVMGLIAFLSGTFFLPVYIYRLIGEKDEWRLKKTAVVLGVIFSASLSIATLTPSKNTLIAMLGGQAIYDITQTEDAKRIGGKTLSALEAWLDKKEEKVE